MTEQVVERSRFLTTSAVARAAQVPEEAVRALEDRGIVRAERDSNNRRLFTADAIDQIKAYRRRGQR